jgi:PAT family beta-lactamase induction signal transducer AmpG
MIEKSKQPTQRLIWLWVLAGFLFQTIPAAIRDEALPVALKNAGLANATITQVVSILGLIVTCKVLWAPILTLIGKPRRLILTTQVGTALILLALAYAVSPQGNHLMLIGTALALLSLCSAAHDFLLDGYYVSSLSDRQRSTHAGLLSFASKLGQVLAGPGLIWLAGYALTHQSSPSEAWSHALYLAALATLGILVFTVVAFNREPNETTNPSSARETLNEMKAAVVGLLRDSRLPALLGLIVFYRLSEVHLIRVVPLFSLDSHDHGGLALSNEHFAFLRLVTAIFGLALGGIIGSWIIAQRGLAKSLLPLGVSMHLPLFGIAWLSYYPQQPISIVSSLFFIEYVAFGAGVCALLLAMMRVASGAHAAVRYAILSSLAVLSVYIPGLWAGALSERLGYSGYFVFSIALAIPGLVSAAIAQRQLREG